MTRLTGKHVGAAGAAGALMLLATHFIGAKEGRRNVAYRDSIGKPTICIGETRGVRMGMRLSNKQCDDLFAQRLARDFAPALERCVPDARSDRTMKDDVYVAFLSLSYNIGSGGFCRSSVARLWNAGDHRSACHALLRYDRAGGRVMRGLASRRRDEERLCLKGL